MNTHGRNNMCIAQPNVTIVDLYTKCKINVEFEIRQSMITHMNHLGTHLDTYYTERYVAIKACMIALALVFICLRADLRTFRCQQNHFAKHYRLLYSAFLLYIYIGKCIYK